MRDKIILILYFLAGAVHLYTVYFYGEYPDVALYSKAALMPILMLSCFALRDATVRKVGLPVMAALFFSWIGDIVLIQEEYFIYGLAAFFIAHVFYIISFLKSNFINHEVSMVNRAPIFMIALVFVGALIFMILKPNLDELMIPVAFYIAIIIGMNAAALNRYKKVNTNSFWLIMIGALLFMLSDSIIAFNKFDHHIENARIYIMITYIVAQFLIVRGTLRRLAEVD